MKSRDPRTWLPPHWRGPLAVAGLSSLVGVIALVLRLLHLDQLPAGLHGDEAVVGLEAERVLREGWIGLYSPIAAGQPAGPLYAWAPVVGVFGNSIFAVRVVAAIVGATTVVAAFLLLRRDFGLLGAFLVSFFLATTIWHLHYSRIAFPLVFWPLLIVFMQWALVRAFQSGRPRWWILAGALVAAGVYVYNAHWMAGAAVALAGLAFLAIQGRAHLRLNLKHAAIAAGAALIVLLPILRLVADSDSVYTSHFERDNYIGSDEWQTLSGVAEHAEALGTRYIEVWRFLLALEGSDNVDAAGIIAMLSVPLLLLAAWGAVSGARNERLRWWWLTSLALVLVMPLASVLSLEGLPRRTFAMAIPLAILAGVAVVDVGIRLQQLPRFAPARQFFAPAVLALAIAVCVPGISAYFSTFAGHPDQRWVFVDDFTQASLYLDDLDRPGAMLVASGRHSVDYATRRFLAPGLGAVDWQSPGSAPPSGEVDAVLVLVDSEQGHRADALEAGAEELIPPYQTGDRFTVLCFRCSADVVEEIEETEIP